MNLNTMTFAARDFSARRGASDEHIPKWICEERATKSGRKRTAARRVAPNLACGVVARRLQPHFGGMRPPRASPQAKLGATNVIVFMFMTTKVLPAACRQIVLSRIVSLCRQDAGSTLTGYKICLTAQRLP